MVHEAKDKDDDHDGCTGCFCPHEDLKGGSYLLQADKADRVSGQEGAGLRLETRSPNAPFTIAPSSPHVPGAVPCTPPPSPLCPSRRPLCAPGAVAPPTPPPRRSFLEHAVLGAGGQPFPLAAGVSLYSASLFSLPVVACPAAAPGWRAAAAGAQGRRTASLTHDAGILAEVEPP